MTDFASLKGEVNNWNLESDEKLLNRLDNFLNNILNQCDTIQKNTELVAYETNSVSIYLHDTFNSLSNLSNKKFIESCMAPVDTTLPPKKETEAKPENPGDNKIRYQQAVKNAIQALSIGVDDEDLSKTASNTMTAMNIFKGTEGLPFIIGSRAFNDDEFVGIVDKTEEVLDFLKGGKGNRSSEMILSSPNINQQANNDVQTNQLERSPSNPSTNNVNNNTNNEPNNHNILTMNSNTQPVVNNNNNLPPPILSQAATNMLKNNTVIVNQSNLLPPPSLLLPNLNTQLSNPAPINTIDTRSNSSNQTQPQINTNPGLQPISKPQLLPPSLTPIQTQKLNEIKTNPLYQQPTVKKSEKLFEDEDEEVGNKDLFKTNNKNKDKFQNLLTSANPFNPNPFDPFGLQNPFLPARQSQLPRENKAGKDDPLLTLANDASLLEPSDSGNKKSVKEEETPIATKRDKLNKLFEDSDEDEESRINKQKKLSERYKKEAEEQKPQPTTSNNRITKLFNDDEEDSKPLTKKEEKPPARLQTKKTLFDDDDEVSTLPKKEEPRPSISKGNKGLFADEEEKSSPLKTKDPEPVAKQLTTKIKPARGSLFKDDDDGDEPKPKLSLKEQKSSSQETSSPQPIVSEKNISPTETNKQEPIQPKEVQDTPKSAIEQDTVSNTTQQQQQAPSKPNNFAALFTKAKLNKRKQSESEEDDDSDVDKPVRKPATRNESQPQSEQKPIIEENIKKDEPSQESNELSQENKEPSEEGRKSSIDANNNRPSTMKVSSRISELQKNLNLKADVLLGGRESLTPWRQSQQPKVNENEEKVEAKSENESGLGLETSLQKPSITGRGRKTIRFEDEDEEPEPEKSKPQEKPILPEIQKPISIDEIPMTTSSIVTSDPKFEANTNATQFELRESIKNETPKQLAPRESSTKTITFEEGPPMAQANQNENPLNLLRGLKELDEDKTRKSEKSSPTKVSIQPSGDNPLALLSGLRELDNERKSSRNKKKDLFEDVQEKKSIGKKGGLFDDEDNTLFKPQERGPSLKVFDDEPKTLAVKQRESKGLKKLFDDSDEDGGNFGSGKPSLSKLNGNSNKPSVTKKPRASLFDDDD